ncbi:MAG TPA: transcriptional repressor [Aggregicoccus sp.]|nr:transcriptional repressor [Aggregicoccus sp.]
MASKKRTPPRGAHAAPKTVQLQQKLRGAGLRSTAPRVAVLRRLERATTPLSHADLVDALADQGLDRVTLYRNLNDLAEAGLVARTDLGDHTWRFELRREGASHATLHPHFTCTDCGAVACLPEQAVRVGAGRGLPKALAHRTVEVALRGLCDRCD